jgi:hypothetical protein
MTSSKLVANLSRIGDANIKTGLLWAETERLRDTSGIGDSNLNSRYSELRGGRHNPKQGPCHGSLRMDGQDAFVTLHQWRDCPHQYGYEMRSSGDHSKIKPREPLSVEIGTAWSDWLFNRSWASDYFAAPSFEFARDVAVFIPTSAPANYCLAMATLTRHGGEMRNAVQRWYDLLQQHAGMTEELAYAIAFGIKVPDSGYGLLSGGHNTLHPSDLAYLANIVKRNIVLTKRPGNTGESAQGVNAMWGPSNNNIANELERIAAQKADEIVIPNPFAPVIAKSAVSERLIQAAIPRLIEMMETRDVARAA